MKLVVAGPVAMALHACDGEKDQRRTSIADNRDPWRSARENGGGGDGWKKVRVFLVERESTKGGERYLSEHGGRTEVFK
jgi:hypothetical protein